MGLLSLIYACSSTPEATPAPSSATTETGGSRGAPVAPAPGAGLPASNADPNAPAGAGAPAIVPSETDPVELAPTGAGGSSDDGESTAGEGGSAEPTTPPDEPTTPPDEPTTPPDEPPSAGPVTLFLAGDSTVQTYVDTPSQTDQAGWGQMLGAFVSGDVSVDNRAIGGRTARRFIDEGRLDEVSADLLPGDYLLVQFGTNDGNRSATYQLGDEDVPYFLEPATDFKTWLARYVDAARARGAIPVFVTPPPRNSAYCTGGNGTGAHAQAMRELGQALGVGVVDLNADTVAHLRAICPAPTPENFFLLRADGTVDGTHFQENGARTLASFVARGLAAAAPDLAGAISD